MLSLLSDLESNDKEKQTKALLKTIDEQIIEIVPYIYPLLDSTSISVRYNAVSALGQLRVNHQINEVGMVLINKLNDLEEIIRTGVIKALSNLQYIQAIPFITPVLSNDTSASVRTCAAGY